MAKIGSYLYLAQRDAVNARQMFDLDEYNACGRFCEQAVEKGFKSFIEQHGNTTDQPLLRIHKPRRLYERCCELGLDAFDKRFAMELSVFSEYYFDTNYPGDNYFELTKEQAQDALTVVNKVMGLVSKQTPNLDAF